MPEFSPEQRKVIDLRDCNILVSAAAGSGKTTVLVERIIQRLLDENDPVNIDELLVLTFTNAAAGEMRERISKAINDNLILHPDNEHLKTQAMLIFNAMITTIDSFCLSVLKNNFTEIGLEPGFRTANEAEMKFITEDILDETVEEIIGSEDTDIRAFLDRFESKDSVKKIRAAIYEAYAEANKAPFVEDYFDEHVGDYDAADYEDLTKKTWFIDMMQKITDDIKETVHSANTLLDRVRAYGPAEYEAAIEKDVEMLTDLAKMADYRALSVALSNFKFGDIGRSKADDSIKEPIKKGRELYKDLINGIVKNYFFQDIDVTLASMKKTARVNRGLMECARIFYQKLEEEKRKRGIITFSDMEHMALKILLAHGDGGYVPSAVARDYRMQYKELMIDEYQDSNYIQEALIHAISREDEGVYDRFIVGDVKQSIYRFRNANPELFMSKYLEYDKEDGPLRRIDLSKNYRSRDEVLSTVNVVFERVMDKDIGGVDYDADSRLYTGAEYYVESGVDNTSELLIVPAKEVGEYKAAELESMLIVKRIKELISDFKVQDKDKMRACEYRDIVILVRSTGDFTDTLGSILEEAAVPAFFTSKTGYFGATEVVTLLNYLGIINNPYNDNLMYGSLKSLFGDFSENEIALIKIINSDSLYKGVKYLTETALEDIYSERPEIKDLGVDIVKDKCIRFVEKLDCYRDMVKYTPIHELLRLIIDDFEYIPYFQAFPMGDRRRANIDMLLVKAESFETDGFRGLFNFIRYIEKLHKYEEDEGEVITLDENANVVRIMTMHKSKGLEFPVCILANMSKGMNRLDERKEVVYHTNYGMAMNYIDVKRRAKYSDMRKKFLVSRIHSDSLSEELRILYVAMTRAKEKLIMTAVSDKVEELPSSTQDTGLAPYTERVKIGSYLDVIRASRFSDDWNGQLNISVFTSEDLVNIDAKEALSMQNRFDRLTAITENSKDYADKETAASIREYIEYEYPYDNLKGLYTKTSVSELKMSAINEGLLAGEIDDIPDDFFKVHEPDRYVPSFIREDESHEVSGATRGSAYHRVMELLPFSKVTDVISKESIDEIMNACIKEGRISEADYKLVDISKVIRFLESDLGVRMREADKRGDLFKEQPFVLGVPANRLSKEYPESETVLVQGIIDAFFYEGDDIILMDYKTDHVKSESELVDRYKTQLDYYDDAISRISGKKVSERIIYSFALEKILNL